MNEALRGFVSYWTGRGADFDGYYGDQCVDLIQFYNRDVVKAPRRFSGNAADIINQTAGGAYTRLPANATPQPGDIVVFERNADNGNAGHIAIVTAVRRDGFTSFDQNFPTGSKPHLQNHPYYQILGYLRPNNQASGNMDDKRIAIENLIFRLTGRLHSYDDINRNHLNDDYATIINKFFKTDPNGIKELKEGYDQAYTLAYGAPKSPEDAAARQRDYEAHRLAGKTYWEILAAVTKDALSKQGGTNEDTAKLQEAKRLASEISGTAQKIQDL